MKSWLPLLWLLCTAGATAPAVAGRPLNTDDASTTGAGTCQIENWLDHHSAQRYEFESDPACGLSSTIELDLDLARSVDGTVEQRAGGGIKWVDPRLRVGGMQFGLKLSQDHSRAGDSPWRAHERSLNALATTDLSTAWALDLNLGHIRDLAAGQGRTTYGAALRWRPAPLWLFGAELFGDDRSVVQQALSLRWWADLDHVALDLGWVNRSGPGDSTRAPFVSLGLCWYGLFE